MISNQLLSEIYNHEKLQFSGEQKLLLEKLAEFSLSIADNRREVFLLKGYAGTGKTTLISILIKALHRVGVKSVLMAPTGRAAKVFSSISGKSAFTIHKKIYRQKSAKDGFGTFDLQKNLFKNTLFIVDEASMIANNSMEASVFGSGKLLDDLIDFVFEGLNCKLILMGDVAQLPPVGLSVSPALDAATLEAYGLAVHEITLREIFRQQQNSDILENATKIRSYIDEENYVVPGLNTGNGKDFFSIGGQDLLEKLSGSYDKTGTADTIIVCRSNKQANKYNEGIRRSIFWYDEEIAMGDYMMVVKNNYFWVGENEKLDFIANGDIFRIVKIKNYEERYGYRFANIVAQFIDYDNYEIELKIFLDSIYIDKASFSQQENRDLYYKILEDFQHLKGKKKQYEAVKNDPFFNALQVKFAYAVTCHKAQGGQWKNVFVDQGYFKEEMVDKEYLRWLYTAITRASDQLYLVNFPDIFFKGNF